jgi:hypothetical protein
LFIDNDVELTSKDFISEILKDYINLNNEKI